MRAVTDPTPTPPLARLLAILMCGLALAPASCTSPAQAKAPEAARPPAQPEELGAVRWMRGFEAAQARARQTGRPLLVLFTEVPGCSTVKGFANSALRDPRLVEAIEAHFVPVAVYNNTSGDADARVLKAFGEPAWNNPVVRIMDAERKPLAPRFAGPYTPQALLDAMVTALKRASPRGEAPPWLSLLQQERRAQARGVQTATLSMYCFWSGEAKLGAMPGVVASRTGFVAGREVVEVTYDPRVVSYDQLVRAARTSGAATGAITRTAQEQTSAKAIFGARSLETGERLRPSTKDDKKQLQGTPWAKLKLTPAQASRVNAAVGRGEDPTPWLSPTQRAQLGRRGD